MAQESTFDVAGLDALKPAELRKRTLSAASTNASDDSPHPSLLLEPSDASLMPGLMLRETSTSSQDISESDSEKSAKRRKIATVDGIPACLFNTSFCNQRFQKSCYFDATVRWGVQFFAPYNHMLLPMGYTTPNAEEEYWNLKNSVCLWDVAVEKQIELAGPDAMKLAEKLTPRPMASMKVGDCRYAILVDEKGLVLNDPLALRIAEDRIWFSIADSDILLWAKGLALGMGLDVQVNELDVAPLAVQGPKSRALMCEVFGDWVAELKLFTFRQTELDGRPMIVARSGWSPELGYEIYLQDPSFGDELWEKMMAYGSKYNITPGVPNNMRRMEGGMLSYGADMTGEYNSLELGLPMGWTGPNKKADFLGKKALQKILDDGGVHRTVMGVQFANEEGDKIRKLPKMVKPWRIFNGITDVGFVTSSSHSPEMNCNLGLATLYGDARTVDKELVVHVSDTDHRRVTVRKLPFLPRADVGM
eukprot:TRINITY_DN123461_c0_g1_i1.p1 TRINITY_DN123461_c0_g1~~TRINITY_DN123461_c0_g1_i1.p1  ORF type:complete len:510 (+),score=130.77 TRINITY_DN123461_c0_g1_i1:104-1531(+)